MASRSVFIAYDHSKNSEHAVSWVLDHNILQQNDRVIVGTVVDEDPSKVYDTLTLQAAGVSSGEWLVEDYKQRVEGLEKDANGILRKVAQQIQEKGVRFSCLVYFSDVVIALFTVLFRWGASDDNTNIHFSFPVQRRDHLACRRRSRIHPRLHQQKQY